MHLQQTNIVLFHCIYSPTCFGLSKLFARRHNYKGGGGEHTYVNISIYTVYIYIYIYIIVNTVKRTAFYRNFKLFLTLVTDVCIFIIIKTQIKGTMSHWCLYEQTSFHFICVCTFGIQTSIGLFDPCQYLSHSSIMLSALCIRLPINQVRIWARL
jgi:hypothetical protein